VVEEETTGIEEIPVKLSFEFGNLTLSIAELNQLAPGAVFPLARPVGEALDIIANGTRIGYGSLVKIGDSVGVRVTRLNGQ
jgi:type III secretion protein Q